MQVDVEVKETVMPKTSAGLGLWSYGLIVVLFTTVVSLLLWYLIGDPQVSLFKLYPQPFGAFLFWIILVLVFIGFNGEGWPFTAFRQPAAGIWAVVVNAVLASIIVCAFTFVYGAVNPTSTRRKRLDRNGLDRFDRFLHLRYS